MCCGRPKVATAPSHRRPQYHSSPQPQPGRPLLSMPQPEARGARREARGMAVDTAWMQPHSSSSCSIKAGNKKNVNIDRVNKVGPARPGWEPLSQLVTCSCYCPRANPLARPSSWHVFKKSIAKQSSSLLRAIHSI